MSEADDPLLRVGQSQDPQDSTPPFPELTPLSHDLDLLSPIKSPDFDLDQFLLSRTKASDLNHIISDLRSYGQNLKEELVAIINHDYKDFVSLGSGLESESHRIARLGWSSSPSTSASPRKGEMAPVRETLVRSRDTLRGVEREIQDCMRRREEARERKVCLDLMLQLHDSVTRLEGLLLIPSSGKGSFRRSSYARSYSANGDPATPRDHDDAVFEDDAEESDQGSEDALSSDLEDDSDDDYFNAVHSPQDQALSSSISPEDSPKVLTKQIGALPFSLSPNDMDGAHQASSSIHSKHQQLQERRKKRRRSGNRKSFIGVHGSMASRSPESPTSPIKSLSRSGSSKLLTKSAARMAMNGKDDAISSSLLSLPQRISRTSAEFSRLGFLSKRVQEQGLQAFSNVLKERIDHIRTTLRRDLRALLKALLSPQSLLVRGPWDDGIAEELVAPRRSSIVLSPRRHRSSSTRGPQQAAASGPSNITGPAQDLESWSQVALLASEEQEQQEAKGDEEEREGGTGGRRTEREYWEERRSEQRGWLEMVLNTFVALGPSSARQAAATKDQGLMDHSEEFESLGAREAEEAVRESLVRDWMAKAINSSSLEEKPPPTSTPKTPMTLWTDDGRSRKEELAYSSEVESRLLPILLDWEKLSRGMGPCPVEADEPLLRLYNKILTFVARDCWHICQAADLVSGSSSASKQQQQPKTLSDLNETGNGAKGSQSWGKTGGDASNVVECNVFVNVIWDEISTRLTEELGGTIFFVGRTATFYRNYTITQAFLDSLADLAPSSRAFEQLVKSNSWNSFKRRWQLPVYFQMKFREVITRLEEGLLQGTLPSSSGDGLEKEETGSYSTSWKRDQPLLRGTRVAIESFASPWKDGVHLHELSAREWRVSLQILSRYKGWIESELPEDLMAAITAGGVATHPNQNQNQNQPNNRLEGLRQHARSGSDGSAGGRGSMEGQSRGWNNNGTAAVPNLPPSRTGTPLGARETEPRDIQGEDQMLNHLTCLAADSLLLETKVHEIFDNTILPRLVLGQVKRGADDGDDGDDEVMFESLRGVLEESLSYRKNLLPLVRRAVTGILKSRCAEPLRLVRSINTQYRSGVSSPSSSTGSSAGKTKAGGEGQASLGPEPSAFVDQVLRPLFHFLGGRSADEDAATATSSSSAHPTSPALKLDREVREDWSIEVVEDVVNRYASSLLTMNKNHESLRRLKRGNKGIGGIQGMVGGLISGGGGGASSLFGGGGAGSGGEDVEGERMRRQMESDVDRLESEVARLGKACDVRIELKGWPAWERLRRACKGSTEDLY
ncbi:COG2-domain-containing protein [Violaceomyces palustris]|uniref:COG2-domain-containing protein n=1 Tax=Violaceomyces palustris TaxID=1673888 RepID=A0ACD0NQQ2_9BASI|nr:COG2-domain-containing protein [Violaceomyces palustris]